MYLSLHRRHTFNLLKSPSKLLLLCQVSDEDGSELKLQVQTHDEWKNNQQGLYANTAGLCNSVLSKMKEEYEEETEGGGGGRQKKCQFNKVYGPKNCTFKCKDPSHMNVILPLTL